MRSLTIKILDQEDKELYSCKGDFNDKSLSPNTKINWTEENSRDIKMINQKNSGYFIEAYEILVDKLEYIKNNSGPITPSDFQYKILTEVK